MIPSEKVGMFKCMFKCREQDDLVRRLEGV